MITVILFAVTAVLLTAFGAALMWALRPCGMHCGRKLDGFERPVNGRSLGTQPRRMPPALLSTGELGVLMTPGQRTSADEWATGPRPVMGPSGRPPLEVLERVHAALSADDFGSWQVGR